jgi:hypothetical protein
VEYFRLTQDKDKLRSIVNTVAGLLSTYSGAAGVAGKNTGVTWVQLRGQIPSQNFLRKYVFPGY